MVRGKEKAPGQRQLRVGEELRHLLARLLNAGEARDPALSGVSITVSEVRVSPDLKNATAFVLPLGGQEAETVVKALRRAAPFFRHRLAEEAALRYAPRLAFELDRSFEEAARIEELLHSERVRRDLAAGEGTQEEAPGEDKDASQD